MKKNPYLKNDNTTTVYGMAGESIQGLAFILPPPFNFIALGVGLAVKGVAWYAAKDRTASPDRLSNDTSDNAKAPLG